MPSGSKKRKAAKKKMAEEANNSNSPPTHSHGDDDPKHHDEKESDGGEVSSPASQDHHSHTHSFTEGEEEEVEKQEDSSSVRKFVTENKSQEGVNHRESTQDAAIEEEGVVQIDTELNPVEDSKGEIVIIESPKESHDGSSESSNSGSSDDESRVLEKNTIVLETAPPVDSIKQVVHVNGSDSVDNSMTSDVVVESRLTENGEKKLPILDENTRVSPVVMDLGSQKNEDEVVLTSDQYATASSDSQPLVASAPRTVQTTSLKGCCGMFELLTGSNR